MKNTILLLLMIIPVIAIAQETKKVTKEYENPYYSEVYYVLKSDKNVKHGSYKKLGHKNTLQIDGYYKNGLRDSVWTEYRGEDIRSHGSYSQDEKVGVWEYYDLKGNLEQKYDHSSKKLVYFKLDDKEKDKEYKVINAPGDTVKVKLDRPPLCIGGSTALLEIMRSVNYPAASRDMGLQGQVLIAFTVDTSGKTSDPRVIEGFDPACNAEALRAVKKFTGSWLPGILNGQAVNAEYVYTIRFTIR